MDGLSSERSREDGDVDGFVFSDLTESASNSRKVTGSSEVFFGELLKESGVEGVLEML